MALKIRSKQITLDSGLDITGSLNVSGSVHLQGQTVIEPTENGQIGLVVSGAMQIVDGYVQAMVQSASLSIGNLGTFGNSGDNKVIDLGGLF